MIIKFWEWTLGRPRAVLVPLYFFPKHFVGFYINPLYFGLKSSSFFISLHGWIFYIYVSLFIFLHFTFSLILMIFFHFLLFTCINALHSKVTCIYYWKFRIYLFSLFSYMYINKYFLFSTYVYSYVFHYFAFLVYHLVFGIYIYIICVYILKSVKTLLVDF